MWRRQGSDVKAGRLSLRRFASDRALALTPPFPAANRVFSTLCGAICSRPADLNRQAAVPARTRTPRRCGLPRSSAPFPFPFIPFRKLPRRLRKISFRFLFPSETFPFSSSLSPIFKSLREKTGRNAELTYGAIVRLANGRARLWKCRPISCIALRNKYRTTSALPQENVKQRPS